MNEKLRLKRRPVAGTEFQAGKSTRMRGKKVHGKRHAAEHVAEPRSTPARADAALPSFALRWRLGRRPGGGERSHAADEGSGERAVRASTADEPPAAAGGGSSRQQAAAASSTIFGGVMTAIARRTPWPATRRPAAKRLHARKARTQGLEPAPNAWRPPPHRDHQ